MSPNVTSLSFCEVTLARAGGGIQETEVRRQQGRRVRHRRYDGGDARAEADTGLRETKGKSHPIKDENEDCFHRSGVGAAGCRSVRDATILQPVLKQNMSPEPGGAVGGTANMNPLGLLYSFQFVLLLVCAAFYYKAADLEDASGILWSGLSILVFLLSWRLLGWGLPGNLFGQAVLFGAITLTRVFRDRKNRS
jgi:hypothetical protein